MENISPISRLLQSGLNGVAEPAAGCWGGHGNDVFLGCGMFFILIVSLGIFLYLRFRLFPGKAPMLNNKAYGMPKSHLMPEKIQTANQTPDAASEMAPPDLKDGPKSAPETLKAVPQKAVVTVNGKPVHGGLVYYKGFMVGPGTPQSVIAKYKKEAASITANQPYKKDLEIRKADTTLIGMHKAYYDEYNRRIINELMGKLVFPVFCYSYKGVLGGELVKPGDGGAPAVFRMNDWYRMAGKGTIKMWKDSMMFIGGRENIFLSMLLMVGLLKRISPWSGNDMVTDMFYLVEEIYKSGILNGETEEKNKAGYNIDNGTGLAIMLGRQSMEKLRPSEIGLRPVCQVPFGLGGYRPLGFDEKSAPAVKIGSLSLKMHSVLLGLYGHKDGAVIDMDSGTVTGSYEQIKRFLADIRKTYVLSWRDRGYLDFFNERKTT